MSKVIWIKGKNKAELIVWAQLNYKSRLSQERMTAHSLLAEFDRPGERSLEWDCCYWQWLTFWQLGGSHLQSQSELYLVRWWYYTLVIDLIGQLRRDVIGRLSVKPWCYWLWRLVISYRFVCKTYIRVAHKPITTLRRLLTNVKDKDKPEDRQGAVYKIKCCDCQASYIGETDRNLSTRLTEHKRATRNGDANNHIAEHHLQTKHQIDWDSATCITFSTDCYQRLT